jgi:hypothetical protein
VRELETHLVKSCESKIQFRSWIQDFSIVEGKERGLLVEWLFAFEEKKSRKTQNLYLLLVRTLAIAHLEMIDCKIETYF